MSERIIIDFDDEKNKKKRDRKKQGERIIIDFDDEKEKRMMIIHIEVNEIEESYEEKILSTKIQFILSGSPHLNNYYESGITFPKG